jgi:hypothetical protein
MEYLTYILIICGIMGLCFLLFRNGAQASMDSGFKKRRMTGQIGGVASESPTVQKPSIALAVNIPTPWGWPGNDPMTHPHDEHGVSESLHRFVDHLLSEKKTIKNREYLLKREENLRLLVEDRFGVSRPRADQDGAGSKSDAGSPIRFNRKTLREIRTPWGW